MKELKKALTFDDILLVPAHSEVLPKEVDLTSRLTNQITLNTPIISAAMEACYCNCSRRWHGSYS